MAALAITSANVVPTATTQIVSGPLDVASATLSAGMYVYRAANGQWAPSVANGTSLQAVVQGMALNPVVAVGGAIRVGTGQITIGTHGITLGLFHFISTTAGEAGPIADLSSTNYVSAAGWYDSATTIVVNPVISGVPHG